MERTLQIISYLLFLYSILLFALFSGASGNDDVDALIAFKVGLDDPNNYFRSWDGTLVDSCTWFHVHCNNINRVTRIDLGNANISGPMVADLGKLEFLEYLELFTNNLNGTIPQELGKLTNLVSLDLFENRLTGKIPEALGNLRVLKYLRLDNNVLIGDIPMSLANLNLLQVLDLSYNCLTGNVPTSGSFSNFTPVSFEYNPLSSSQPGYCGPP